MTVTQVSQALHIGRNSAYSVRDNTSVTLGVIGQKWGK